jgi:hypothetical protein
MIAFLYRSTRSADNCLFCCIASVAPESVIQRAIPGLVSFPNRAGIINVSYAKYDPGIWP